MVNRPKPFTKMHKNAASHHPSKWFRARSVVGLAAANSIGDDIELMHPQVKQLGPYTLRQQKRKTNSDVYYAPPDFIAPNQVVSQMLMRFCRLY